MCILVRYPEPEAVKIGNMGKNTLMFGQIVQALMVEMVREMNIFADSGTAGIDLSSLQTNYQGR